MKIPQQARLDYNLGLPEMPLKHYSKLPALPWEKYLTNQSTWEEREQWFYEKQYNIGVLGSDSLAVQDFETRERFEQFYPKWEQLTEKTRCVLTAHQGVHVYWHTLEPIRRSLKICPDLDLCGVGGYVVGAGSKIDHADCRPSKKCPGWGTTIYRVMGTYQIALAERNLAEIIRERAKKLSLPLSETSEASASKDSEAPRVERIADKPITQEELDKIAEVLARHWLPEYRHKLVLATMGFLVRKAVSEDAAVSLFLRVLTNAGDPFYFDEREIRRQYQCSLKAPRIQGYSTLVKVFRQVEQAKGELK